MGGFLEEHIGMRSMLVRIHHELDYQLFGKTHSPGVVIGKEGMLFERDYIDEYLGKGFLGQALWEAEADRVRALTDLLRDSLGIRMMFVIPPGKARIYPEMWGQDTSIERACNYRSMTEAFRRQGIALLDLHPVFNKWKEELPYSLFSKGGGHWSEFGSSMAIDTILSFMADQTDLPPPRVDHSDIRTSSRPEGLDADLSNVMNRLGWGDQKQDLAYRSTSIEYSPAWEAGDWLVIGDSYFDQMVFARYFDSMSGSHPDLWRYNQNILHRYEYTGWPVGPEALAARLDHTSFILVFISERFMHTLFWGFISDLEQVMDPVKEPTIEAQISRDILNNVQWSRYIQNRGNCKGISFEQALREEADAWLEGSSGWRDGRQRKRYLPDE